MNTVSAVHGEGRTSRDVHASTVSGISAQTPRFLARPHSPIRLEHWYVVLNFDLGQRNMLLEIYLESCKGLPFKPGETLHQTQDGAWAVTRCSQKVSLFPPAVSTQAPPLGETDQTESQAGVGGRV